MFDIILVTVCIDNLHINKLLDSIYLNNKHVKANVIIVNQNNNNLYIENNLFNNFNFINLTITDKNYLNSSSSRNIAFEYILKNKIKSHFICFPDDDTTFDSYFFEQLKKIISSGIYNNYIFDVYCNNSNILYFVSAGGMHFPFADLDFLRSTSKRVCVKNTGTSGAIVFRAWFVYLIVDETTDQSSFQHLVRRNQLFNVFVSSHCFLHPLCAAA